MTDRNSVFKYRTYHWDLETGKPIPRDHCFLSLQELEAHLSSLRQGFIKVNRVRNLEKDRSYLAYCESLDKIFAMAKNKENWTYE